LGDDDKRKAKDDKARLDRHLTLARPVHAATSLTSA
jgi:hypothetical protein